MLRLDKAAYSSLVVKSILSVRLSSSLSDVALFLEFKNMVSILFYNFIEFILLFYNFRVTSFSRYKQYIIFLISFSKFSEVLPAFICACAIGNP